MNKFVSKCFAGIYLLLKSSCAVMGNPNCLFPFLSLISNWRILFSTFHCIVTPVCTLSKMLFIDFVDGEKMHFYYIMLFILRKI